jgi:hypothetical protein
MFDPNSRYFEIEVATITQVGADGKARELRYARRRFIEDVADQEVVAEHRVAPGERIDNVAARYLGDPTAFWRICDANGVLEPNELTDEAGRVVRIVMPNR